MILLLHEEQEYVIKFKEYMDLKGVDYIALSSKELVKSIRIEDRYLSPDKSVVWQIRNKKIEFNKITGIYNAITDLSLPFEDYVEEDRDYVRVEWNAYFRYIINSFKNSINPITPEMMSGLFFQIPFLFKSAQKNGFSVPKYMFSAIHDELKSFAEALNYTVCNTLYDCNQFRKSKSLPEGIVGAIEYISGASVILQKIDRDIFSWKVLGDHFEMFNLPVSVLKSVEKFVSNLNLKACEILIKINNEGEYIFHSCSPLIHSIYYNSTNINQTYDSLIRKLKYGGEND